MFDVILYDYVLSLTMITTIYLFATDFKTLYKI